MDPEAAFGDPRSRLRIAGGDDDISAEGEDVGRGPLVCRNGEGLETPGERQLSHRIGRQEEPASEVATAA
jgi:hypothetical protein